MLRSDALEVRLDTAFPRIVSYTDRGTGAVLHGQDTAVTQVLIDGTARTPHVTHHVRADRATYTLTFDGGTAITVEIAVRGWQTTWRVTGITDTPALRVGTLEIPGLALLGVRSDQPGAALLAARIELDKAKSGDTLVKVADDTPAEPSPTGCAYAVVATDRLAAAIETNTVHDTPTGATTWENGRLWRQTVHGDGFVTARLGCGQWTHRAAGAPVDATDPLPYATVIVTRDRNGDGRTDWQDAAIALRDIMVVPPGADEQHLRVVPHIAFNFASQATNPFLATLDNVKRIALATDGLRQFTLLKGYQSEGHDSAHPDYGGNYNKRAWLASPTSTPWSAPARSGTATSRYTSTPPSPTPSRTPSPRRWSTRTTNSGTGSTSPTASTPAATWSPATSPAASPNCERRPTRP